MRIVPFKSKHAGAFLELNRAWLVKNNLWEPQDADDLSDPEGTIIAKGGRIYVAERRGIVTGTCAVMPVTTPGLQGEPGQTTMEINRLSVHPDWQRLGIGRRLLARCVGWARRNGADRVVLLSSTKLTGALRLYRAFGFVTLPVPHDAKYATADIFMELTFDEARRPSGSVREGQSVRIPGDGAITSAR